jgi:hypothetical protein
VTAQANALGTGTATAPAGDVTGTVDSGTWDTSSASSASSSNPLSGLLSFANKNPVATLGALQAGGSLLSGLTSTLTPAQVSALQAQANANNAAAALTQQQTANLAMPKAVASSTPVTGTPGQLVPGATNQIPAGTGLLNSAPKVAPVTGTTA